MPGIFSAFTEAQAAGQKFGEDVSASKDLQQAMQETPKDETGKADLFTTYQKAGQIAMQSGQTKVADHFLKQANEFKGDALKLKLDEMKVQEAQLSRFEQHIQGLETADELKESLINSDVPTDQKMRLMPMIDKDPKKFKEMMLNQVQDGKTRATATQKKLEFDLDREKFDETKHHNRVSERIQAINASGKLTRAEKQEEKAAEHIQGRLEKAQDTLTAEKRRVRNLDPKKFDKKAKDELIAQAELDYEEDTAALRKPTKETPTKSDVSSVTPQDKDKLLSLDKEGKLTKGQKEEFDSHYGKGAADKLLGGTKSSSKPGAGQKTHDGYPARENADGSYSTEVSITVTNPKLNNGKPTNIPSLWKGKEVDEDMAVRNALATGKSYKSFNSINEAVSAAKARSEAGGAGADNKPETKKELTDEEQLSVDLAKATGVQERNAIRNDYNIRQERKAKQAKQKAIAAKGKEKTEAAVAKAQKQGLVLSGMSGTQLKFVDPKTGKEVLESEL
jgi:hypothetical protein